MEIPGYRIEEKIAEGGMAAVYRAIQESLMRPVALKVLKEADDPSFSRRFLEEGRIIAALRHPNIITIFDIGVAAVANFISMELVEGGDLDDRIEAGLKPEEAIAIIRKLAECLQFVHGKGVVHRDIKPGNILFRADAEPLLTDFGIAKQLNAKNKLTLDGTALGSPYYLSPEQSQGKKVDGRADIYSLGIVLYEMLTGKLPFEGKAPIDTILMHLQEPLPRLRKSLHHFQPLLDRMTAKDPKGRYRDCAALLLALDGLNPSPGPVRSGRTVSVAPVISGKLSAVTAKSPELIQTMTMAAIPMAKPPPEPKNAAPVVSATPRERDESSRVPRWPWIVLPLLLLLWLTGPSWWLAVLGVAPAANQSLPLMFDWRQTRSSESGQPGKASPQRAERYLELARARMRDNKLTTPDNDNAWHYYRATLQFDPANREALAGIDTIGERYAGLADQALARNAPDKALAYASRGLTVSPGSKRLRELATRLGNAPEGGGSGWTKWFKGLFQ